MEKNYVKHRSVIKMVSEIGMHFLICYAIDFEKNQFCRIGQTFFDIIMIPFNFQLDDRILFISIAELKLQHVALSALRSALYCKH